MEQTPLPTTRAEEIAGDGPYKVEGYTRGIGKLEYFRVVGPSETGVYSVLTRYIADRQAKLLNRSYKQGQQDRWIPLSEKGPAERETVWACDPVTKFVALACRVWIEDGDQGGWLWAVSNGTIYSENGRIVSECEMDDDYNFTQWQSLPALPSPPNPEQR